MSVSETATAGEESARPLVASAGNNRAVWLFGIALVLGGGLLFRSLENRREALATPSLTAPADSSSGMIAAPPTLDIPPAYVPDYSTANAAYPAEAYAAPYGPDASRANMPTPRAPISTTHAASSAGSSPIPPPAPPPTMQEVQAARAAYEPASPPSVPEPPATDGSSSASGGKERVEAVRFANPSTTVPKGTVIQAVLETALDSNRPGFARAIVSRDVMGFDGSKVLIPRGSRIIGEYKSDVTLGQSRVLIQWQRLMRPDGIAINMDSPSADPLGRAGIKGKVNTHFFERFAGAILQSALNVGTQLATQQVSNNAVYIGLPGVTQGMIVPPEKIAPTVKVRQGRSVSVFVARDLDFTKVS